MVKRRIKSRRRSRRTTIGFQPVSTARQLIINSTLASSSYSYWSLGDGSFLCKATSLTVRCAASTPTNIRFSVDFSEDGQNWAMLWSSATGLVGTTPTLIRLRIPRYCDPQPYYRWSAISSGTPTLAGYALFSVRDPPSS